MGNRNQTGASLVEYLLLLALIAVLAIAGYLLLGSSEEQFDAKAAVGAVGMVPSQPYDLGDKYVVAHFEDDESICTADIVFDVKEGGDGKPELWAQGTMPRPVATEEQARDLARNVCEALE
jgi:Flp pilus assembly pilin Flp